MSNRYSPLGIDEPQSTIDVSSDNCSDYKKSNRDVAPAKKPQEDEKSNREVAPAKKPQDLTTRKDGPSQEAPRLNHKIRLSEKPMSPKPSRQHSTGNTIAILGDSMIKDDQTG